MRTVRSDSEPVTEEMVRCTCSRRLFSISSCTLLRSSSAKEPAKSTALAVSWRFSLSRERYQKPPLSGSTTTAEATMILIVSERPKNMRSRMQRGPAVRTDEAKHDP